jgi:hypothetical protein
MDQHPQAEAFPKHHKQRNNNSDQHPFIFNKKTDQHNDQHGSTWINIHKQRHYQNTTNRETTTAINIPSFLTRKRINIAINMDQHGSTWINI